MRKRMEEYSLFRWLLRHFGLFSEAPTSRQLETLAEIQGRVRLVIEARWVFLALLAIYVAYAALFYYLSSSGSVHPEQIVALVLSTGAVVAYNAAFGKYYRELSHLRFFSHLQILLDIAFVTLLVHFSGGVISWFWSVYLIITLESVFLLERKPETWAIGAVGAISYGALLTGEFYDVFPSVAMPFLQQNLQHDFVYQMLMWFWVTIMNATIAIIGSFLMGVIRNRERELKLLVIKDQMTNLYNRAYFFKMLNNEIQRSIRYRHSFSIIMMDMDDFKKYNDSFGHLEGDRLLKEVARTFMESARCSDTEPPYFVDVPCRYGGEEFAIILPETPAVEAEPGGGTPAALALAERIRNGIEALRINGHKTTVSIGVASFPLHGADPDQLVSAADAAMYRAKREGKNRVVLASLPAATAAPTPAIPGPALPA